MYPCPNVCALFQIAPKTLWRWCCRAGIKPHQDPIDNRRRYLTDGQLVKLAQLHRRVLLVDASQVQTNELQRLEARIAELEKQRDM